MKILEILFLLKSKLKIKFILLKNEERLILEFYKKLLFLVTLGKKKWELKFGRNLSLRYVGSTIQVDLL